jgi:hypothetical protein
VSYVAQHPSNPDTAGVEVEVVPRQAGNIAPLGRGGRQCNVAKRAAEMQTALWAEQMQASPVVAGAYATVVASVAHLLEALNGQVQTLEADLKEHFVEHPDAAILLRFLGWGTCSGTTRTACSTRTRDVTTKAPHRSIGPPAGTEASSRGPFAAVDWETHSTGGR